jgi:hypothetical protein
VGLLEWLGESFTPGPIGKVEFEGPVAHSGTRGAALGRGALGLVMLVAVLVGLRLAFPSREAGAVILRSVGIYLLISFFVRARPDRSNVGGFGGFLDHPFRYSDDINRSLMFLAVLMAPGRFVTGSIRDAWHAMTRDAVVASRDAASVER